MTKTKETIADKAIFILGRTNDGDDLAPKDLRLLEMAVNNHLNDRGVAAFEEIYDRVLTGQYHQPWFHGQEHLTKDHQGYVYWKGSQVEHFSYHNADDERAAAIELAMQCRELDRLGVKPTVATRLSVHYLLPFGQHEQAKAWVPALTKRGLYAVMQRETDGVKQAAMLFFVGTPESKEHERVLAGVGADSKYKTAVAIDPILDGSTGIDLFYKLQNDGYRFKPVPHEPAVWLQWCEEFGLEPKHLENAIACAEEYVQKMQAAERPRGG